MLKRWVKPSVEVNKSRKYSSFLWETSGFMNAAISRNFGISWRLKKGGNTSSTSLILISEDTCRSITTAFRNISSKKTLNFLPKTRICLVYTMKTTILLIWNGPWTPKSLSTAKKWSLRWRLRYFHLVEFSRLSNRRRISSLKRTRWVSIRLFRRPK